MDTKLQKLLIKNYWHELFWNKYRLTLYCHLNDAQYRAGNKTRGYIYNKDTCLTVCLIDKAGNGKLKLIKKNTI